MELNVVMEQRLRRIKDKKEKTGNGGPKRSGAVFSAAER